MYTPCNIGEKGKAWILLDVDKNVEPKPAIQDVELVIFRVFAKGDSMCEPSPPPLYFNTASRLTRVAIGSTKRPSIITFDRTPPRFHGAVARS